MLFPNITFGLRGVSVYVLKVQIAVLRYAEHRIWDYDNNRRLLNFTSKYGLYIYACALFGCPYGFSQLKIATINTNTRSTLCSARLVNAM